MKHNKWILRILGLITFIVFYYFISQFFPGLPGYHFFHYTPSRYLSELEKIDAASTILGKEYEISEKKEDVLHRSKYLFLNEMTEKVFPFWIGTDYDFYGQTEVPGRGEIACGYFVTTVLEDMGISLDRAGLAKLASEQMILQLVDYKYIKRYSNQSIKRLIADIEFEGDGVYLVGLDTHTGFIIHKDDLLYFVHASGRRPWKVIEEPVLDSPVLNESAYRVTGQLTADPIFLQSWLSK